MKWGWLELELVSPSGWGMLFSILLELKTIITHFVFSDCRDKWVWDVGSFDELMVSEARRLIDDISILDGYHSIGWNKYVPRKVNIFYRRCGLNRLPIHMKLVYKGVGAPSLVFFYLQRWYERYISSFQLVPIR